jgi:hypothetical protein
LEYAAIVEANGTQALVILPANSGGITRDLGNVVQHRPILIRDRGGLVVLLQRLN